MESRATATLSYNRRSNCWVIKADPNVTELCKRLFPGTVSRRRGEARFTAHRRIIADMNWLMMRYPLHVAERDQTRWTKALEEARDYVRMRQAALRTPARIKPNKASFRGTLTAFQEEGLAFLLRTDRCLLADEMGLGKTVQSLALLSHITAYPAMVVAPAHLIRNWETEIHRFVQKEGGEALTVHTVKGLKPYTLPQADVYLMHYLLLRGWKQYLADAEIEHVIFDEIQELRHSGTEKYSAASLLADHAVRVIGLSGTPIYNRGSGDLERDQHSGFPLPWQLRKLYPRVVLRLRQSDRRQTGAARQLPAPRGHHAPTHQTGRTLRSAAQAPSGNDYRIKPRYLPEAHGADR